MLKWIKGRVEAWLKENSSIRRLFLEDYLWCELLTAVERDGNNHIFPVAWAIVTVENKDNWS